MRRRLRTSGQYTKVLQYEVLIKLLASYRDGMCTMKSASSVRYLFFETARLAIVFFLRCGEVKTRYLDYGCVIWNTVPQPAGAVLILTKPRAALQSSTVDGGTQDEYRRLNIGAVSAACEAVQYLFRPTATLSRWWAYLKHGAAV